jgi:hypothetical protein
MNASGNPTPGPLGAELPQGLEYTLNLDAEGPSVLDQVRGATSRHSGFNSNLDESCATFCMDEPRAVLRSHPCALGMGLGRGSEAESPVEDPPSHMHILMHSIS